MMETRRRARLRRYAAADAKSSSSDESVEVYFWNSPERDKPSPEQEDKEEATDSPGLVSQTQYLGKDFEDLTIQDFDQDDLLQYGRTSFDVLTAMAGDLISGKGKGKVSNSEEEREGGGGSGPVNEVLVNSWVNKKKRTRPGSSGVQKDSVDNLPDVVAPRITKNQDAKPVSDNRRKRRSNPGNSGVQKKLGENSADGARAGRISEHEGVKSARRRRSNPGNSGVQKKLVGNSADQANLGQIFEHEDAKPATERRSNNGNAVVQKKLVDSADEARAGNISEHDQGVKPVKKRRSGHRNSGIAKGLVDNAPDEAPIGRISDNEDLKLISLKRTNSRTKPGSSGVNKKSGDNGPQPPPGLPEQFKLAMEKMANGKGLSEGKLIIQKRLYATDCERGQNRLSIPEKQIVAKDFLTVQEKTILKERDADGHLKYKKVRILDPDMDTMEVHLRMWEMNKKDANAINLDKKTSVSYVLNGKWTEIRLKNKLEADIVVQLWAFRIEDELCFALVKLA